MYHSNKGFRHLKTISVPFSIFAILALVVQSLAFTFSFPASATGCQTLNVWSMGYWKTHQSEWILPQTLGGMVINTTVEGDDVFNNYADSPANKVRGQLLALKFNIAIGAGSGYVPGDVITLNQLASQADAMLQQVPPVTEAELTTMASRIENVNTAVTVSTCLTDKGILIVKKKVVNDNGGTKQPADFTMTVSAVNPSLSTFLGNSSGTTIIVDPGNYEADEILIAGYTKSRTSSCTGTINAGETKYCTIINNDNPTNFCELEIIKSVDKIIANPDDILTYTLNFTNVGTANCTGGGVKVQDEVFPMLDYINETHSSNIDPGYGNDPVFDGSMLRWNAHELTPGETGQITWTASVKPITGCGLYDMPNTARITATQLNWQWVLSNTVHTVVDIACQAEIIVKKHVINDNGGQAEADDFTMLVTAVNPSQGSFPGSETGTSVTVEPGVYSVDEQSVAGYDKTLSADCAGTIAHGESKTCTVTNDDNESIYCELEITKQVDKQIANSGDLLTYSLRVENTGTGVCTGGGVKVQDMVDPRLTYVSENHTPNISAGYGSYPVFFESMLRWNAHELTPGEVGEISWQATVNEITGCGLFDIPNTARVTAQELGWEWVLSNTVHTIVDIACQAELIVKKIVFNDDGGTKQPADFTMQVTGINPNPASFPGSPTGTNVTIEPGDYSVSEIQDPGYAMTLSVDCTGTIAHGESKTCTVTNDDIPPEESKLIVIKHVINDNGGIKVAADFNIDVTAAGNFQQTIPGNETGTEFSVEPGGYLVVEQNSLGYSVSYDNCQGTIAVGETMTCTVTNDDPVPPPPDPAYIIVIKHVSNDDGGTKNSPDFTMHLEAGTGSLNTSFPGAEAPGVQTQVPVGDFNVTEDQDPAYTMTMTGDCTGVIAAGETKTCTITNDDIPPPPPPKGKLVIIKKVINDNGWTKVANDFSILVQAANNFQNIYAGQDAPGVMVDVDPGDYVIEEVDTLGYTKTKSADCSGTIATQEIKTCTITNDDPDKGTLIVIKHVINDSGTGSKSAGDFTMSVTAQNPSQTSFAGVEAPGVTISVDPGDYNVDEVDNFNYTKSRSAECSGTIAAGETKTCTITNNDPSGGGGGGGGGGCTGASCNPNPSPVNATITCGPNATLSFTYGSDVNAISISQNIAFDAATIISPVASIPWAIPAGDGQTVYIKFQRATGSIEIRQATTSNCTPPGQVLSCTNLVTAESELVTSPNQSVINSAKGKLLIQSEAQGQIWYVHYSSGLKYYIPGAPNTMTVVKSFADGITNDNLTKIPLGLSQNIAGTDTDGDNLPDLYEEAIGTNAIAADTDSDGFTDYVELQNGYNPLGADKAVTDQTFANEQKGRFFMQIEEAGQVWYVSPLDGKRYYIPNDSTNAYNVIASLAKNMTNAEIRQISVGQEIKGIDTSAFAGCYIPSPSVLGASTELPRTGFPFDLAQLVIIPGLAAYPWLKRRYSKALSMHFAKFTH